MADGEARVDPAVSRAKFERELSNCLEQQDHLIRRGIWIVKSEFPEVFVVFGTPNMTPAVALFGAIIDFSEYDLLPPSVRLVNPFTLEAYKANQLPTVLKRAIKNPIPLSPEQQAMGINPFETHLMVAHDDLEVPLLCLPGVREYHQHPAHTGDPWLIHRNSGEGSLYFLLNTLAKYGSEPILGYAIQARVTGLLQSGAPE
ncbi:putative metal-binding protein [uncultured Meiothermus sp.]|uniref:putative metal-binding protein n=1 Tax=uncultured Meiothermus sp. TaxID=157471 RepID=UPI002617464F|nr:putative metal-binding protein [uncultured Meiothermus sp.]